MVAPPKVRCRTIAVTDLEGVADLLARGFPARPRAYWMAGLLRLARRSVPEGYPRFGFMLEHEGAPVGVILTIAQAIHHDDTPYVRCSLSSWYVDPAFRSHAALLAMLPFRLKGATLVNVSAAPHTWPTIEAQGFARYTDGQRLALPLLARNDPTLRLAPYGPDAMPSLPEADLLADHAAAGCLCLVGIAQDGPVPFVLMNVRGQQGRWWLPAMQLVFARSPEDVRRFAAPLGRLLLRRGRPFLVYDAQAGAPILPGITLRDRAPKYARGPRRPRPGDLAYTEFTIFGA